jgi:hypothetical protein
MSGTAGAGHGGPAAARPVARRGTASRGGAAQPRAAARPPGDGADPADLAAVRAGAALRSAEQPTGPETPRSSTPRVRPAATTRSSRSARRASKHSRPTSGRRGCPGRCGRLSASSLLPCLTARYARVRLGQLQEDQQRLVRALSTVMRPAPTCSTTARRSSVVAPDAQPVPASARELAASTHAMVPRLGLPALTPRVLRPPDLHRCRSPRNRGNWERTAGSFIWIRRLDDKVA